MSIDGFTAVVGRNSTTVEGVVNRINGLLGKNIESPRDDFPGPVEVFNIVSLQILKTGPEAYYGAAVVEIGVQKESMDVEKEFFSAIKDKA